MRAGEHLVTGSRYESNVEMLWNNRHADILTTDNLITALGWLDDKVLDNSSEKQIDLLLSQQFTET